MESPGDTSPYLRGQSPGVPGTENGGALLGLISGHFSAPFGLTYKEFMGSKHDLLLECNLDPPKS